MNSYNYNVLQQQFLAKLIGRIYKKNQRTRQCLYQRLTKKGPCVSGLLLSATVIYVCAIFFSSHQAMQLTLEISNFLVFLKSTYVLICYIYRVRVYYYGYIRVNTKLLSVKQLCSIFLKADTKRRFALTIILKKQRLYWQRENKIRVIRKIPFWIRLIELRLQKSSFWKVLPVNPSLYFSLLEFQKSLPLMRIRKI